MQITGHKTAISRTHESVPMRYLGDNDLIIGRALDYGCGKGRDALTYDMESYDPHYRPERPAGLFETITCNYVLNVVDEATQHSILADIASLLTPSGKAYITVRRDLPPEGKPGRGCYQRNVSLPDTMCLTEHGRHRIRKFRETASYCTYVLHQGWYQAS